MKKLAVATSSVWRFYDRHEITLKKFLHAAEQDRPDVAAARKELKAEQPALKPSRLVFIDETAVTTKMTRLYGRAPLGERLVAKVPYGHWKTLTLVAALRVDSATAPYVIDGAMDGQSFLAYVEQVLVPTLRKRDIVFMDNVPTHKVAGVREAIEAAGAKLRYLPAYSPDLTPSRMPMPRSSQTCAKAPPAPSTHSGSWSDAASRRLRPPNAPATSDTQAIAPDPHQVESALECAACTSR